MGLAKDKIPTVTIIEKPGYDILDKVNPSAMHQFITTPFSGEGLFGRFERAIGNKKIVDLMRNYFQKTFSSERLAGLDSKISLPVSW